MAIKDTTTFRELKAALDELTDEQLDQRLQVIVSQADQTKAIPCCHGICFGTVKEMEFDYVRSAVDNAYHENDLVLFVDDNPYAEDGAMAYEWTEESTLSDKDSMIPIYPKSHDPNVHDWTGPAQKHLDSTRERPSEFGQVTELLVLSRLQHSFGE